MLLLFLFLYSLHTVSSTQKKEIEELLDVAQTIEYFGYPVEKHYVTTDDGYTSEVQRIPYGRDARTINGCNEKRPVVFFMHGLFASAHEFVMNLPSQSPAFVFADAGFDVWLGNVRGTEYGLNHTTLSPDDAKFWNFTYYEYSHFDLRQQIDYALEVTQHKSLFYVGHSQGTAVMFARLAEADCTWQSKIRIFFALGPTAGFLKPLLPFSLLEDDLVQTLIQLVLDGRFGIIPISIPKSLSSFLADFCTSEVLSHVCAGVFELSDGMERLAQLNTSRVSIFLSHFPSTTSTLNLLHWVQVFKYHELRRLDLGARRNLIAYGQTEAPRLDIGRITAQTVLYFSHDDRITDEVDVKDVLIKNMGPGLIEYYDLDHFSHFDFAIGLRANDEVYKPIIYRIYQEIAEKRC
uniref:Lipase n=1 Tax=Caenorhabditis japonica TaxID=281687 RepID=A0A8R1IRQ4_CAEJA